MSAIRDDIADHVLYRLYFSLMMQDILHKQGYDATQENKAKLHEFHKRILGYESIAGKSHDVLSRFLFDVTCFWAVEKGIFVRTSKKQPINIQDMPLSQCWEWL